jgi:hypothetical protein
MIMTEPKPTGAFNLLADEVTKDDIPLGLMKTSLQAKSSQVNTLPKAKSQAKDKRAKDRQ